MDLYCENMNISVIETPLKIVAKMCRRKGRKNKKVTYLFIDTYHSLCLDKKDILSAELEACERLLKYAIDESERTAIEKEISELRIALDLLS
jgi:hypothetical protein